MKDSWAEILFKNTASEAKKEYYSPERLAKIRGVDANKEIMEQINRDISDFKELTHVQGSIFCRNAIELVNFLTKVTDSTKKWKIIASGDVYTVSATTKKGNNMLFIMNPNGASVTANISHGMESRTVLIAGGESLFADASSFFLEQKNISREVSIDVSGGFSYQIERPNVLRLDTWDAVTMDGQRKHCSGLPIINQLTEAEMNIQAVTREVFGCPKELIMPVMEMEYSCSFENRLERIRDVKLIMEPGTILGEWQMEINEKRFMCKQTHSEVFDGSLRDVLDITNVILKGTNHIKIKIIITRPDGGIRNPIYLYGDFGVFFDLKGKPILKERPPKMQLNGFKEAGLPYYAGRINYKYPLPESLLDELDQDDSVIFTFKSDKFHESLTLQVGEGKREVLRAFAPYRFEFTATELQGCTSINISMDTAMSRYYEGEYFDEKTHRYLPVEFE